MASSTLGQSAGASAAPAGPTADLEREGTKVLFLRMALFPYDLPSQSRIIDVSGRHDRLVKTPEPVTCEPQWAPDGRIATIRISNVPDASSLVTFNRAGGDVRVAFTFPGTPNCGLAWQRRH